MANKIHRTMIGGQAVIEGVMMRGVDKTALAVRKPDGTINLDVWPVTSVRGKHSPLRIPIIRGVVNFVEMLVLGYKTLMKSAEISAPAEDSSEQPKDLGGIEHETLVNSETATPHAADSSEQPEGSGSIEHETLVNSANEATKTEKKSDDGDEGFGKTAMDALTVLSLFLGFAIAILLFVVAPTILVGKTDRFVHWGSFRTVVEGVIKIAIFVAYLALISRMKDIQRVYEYHGAEHKTIYCYEHGDELTPENARKYTRFHPRCGTSFLLIVLIVSIIVFSFVTWKTLWLRIVLKLILLPAVVGISYEIIKFAGRHDNSVMRFLLAPGLWLQRLTTREPDDSQLEVAITSIKAVLTENPEDDKW